MKEGSLAVEIAPAVSGTEARLEPDSIMAPG
jgi:hypothetical protein